MGKATFKFRFNDKMRQCEICGKKFKPKAPNQKYCQKCRREGCPLKK